MSYVSYSVAPDSPLGPPSIGEIPGFRRGRSFRGTGEVTMPSGKTAVGLALAATAAAAALYVVVRR